MDGDELDAARRRLLGALRRAARTWRAAAGVHYRRPERSVVALPDGAIETDLATWLLLFAARGAV